MGYIVYNQYINLSFYVRYHDRIGVVAFIIDISPAVEHNCCCHVADGGDGGGCNIRMFPTTNHRYGENYAAVIGSDICRQVCTVEDSSASNSFCCLNND